MTIPFMNLSKQTEQIWNELDSVWKRIVKNNQFINGPDIDEFETQFAAYCQSAYAVGLSNGTDALILALIGLGIKPGDIVITVPNTFIATTEAISATGAKIEFVDVDPETLLMDTDQLAQKVKQLKKETKPVKAVVPVHLYGQMCDMETISEIARDADLKVIEDSAQAHGATHKGNPPGYYGHVATFSFYPGKNLGAFGDAGALITNNEQLASWVKMAANHGRREKYIHDFEGRNNRLDTLQAAILLVKLKYLDQWTEKRIQNAAIYDLQFENTDIKPVLRRPENRHVYHLYVVQCEQRDKWQQQLKENGISTGIHYPLPLHLQPAYAYLGYSQGDFPVTERTARKLLSLPIDDQLIPTSEHPS